MLGFWIALAVFVLGIVIGLTIAVVRGLQTWRLVKASGGRMSGELDRISQTTAEIEQRLAEAGASQERLREAMTRLSVSRARLQVQLEAIAEARRMVGRVLWFLPR